jgi:hypothetical protein
VLRAGKLGAGCWPQHAAVLRVGRLAASRQHGWVPGGGFTPRHVDLLCCARVGGDERDSRASCRVCFLWAACCCAVLCCAVCGRFAWLAGVIAAVALCCHTVVCAVLCCATVRFVPCCALQSLLYCAVMRPTGQGRAVPRPSLPMWRVVMLRRLILCCAVACEATLLLRDVPWLATRCGLRRCWPGAWVVSRPCNAGKQGEEFLCVDVLCPLSDWALPGSTTCSLFTPLLCCPDCRQRLGKYHPLTAVTKRHLLRARGCGMQCGPGPQAAPRGRGCLRPATPEPIPPGFLVLAATPGLPSPQVLLWWPAFASG